MYYIAIRQNFRVYQVEDKDLSSRKINLTGISLKTASTAKEAFKWLRLNESTVYDADQLSVDVKKLKKKTKVKKDSKDIREKNFDCVYFRNPPSTNKRMPWEFRSDRLTPDMLDQSRKNLVSYYIHGGNRKYIGAFKGQVKEIIPGRGILFKPVKMSFKKNNSIHIEGTVGHVWMIDDSSFLNMGIEVGDCVSFRALAYVYQRKDGTVDIGLKSPYYIKNIRAL